jgi:hypothetical protein
MSAMRRGGVSFRPPPPQLPQPSKTAENVASNCNSSTSATSSQKQEGKTDLKSSTVSRLSYISPLSSTTLISKKQSAAVALLLKRAQSVLEMCFKEDSEFEMEEKETKTNRTYNTATINHQQLIAPNNLQKNDVMRQKVRLYISSLVRAEHTGEREHKEEYNEEEKDYNNTVVTQTTLSLNQEVSKLNYVLPCQSVYGNILSSQGIKRSAVAVHFSSSSSLTSASLSSCRHRPLRKREKKARMKQLFEVLKPVIEKQKIQRNKKFLEIQELTGVTWGCDIQYKDTVTNKEISAQEYMKRYFDLYLASKKKESDHRHFMWNQQYIVGCCKNETKQQPLKSYNLMKPFDINDATFESDLEAAELKCWKQIEVAMRSLKKDKSKLKTKWTNNFTEPKEDFFQIQEGKPEKIKEGHKDPSSALLISSIQKKSAGEDETVEFENEKKRRRRQRRRRRRSIVLFDGINNASDEENDIFENL